MCMLCIEYQKGKMNIQEVRDALRELTAENNSGDPNFWHYVDIDEAADIEETLNEFELDLTGVDGQY